MPTATATPKSSLSTIKKRLHDLPQTKVTDSLMIDRAAAQELLAVNTHNRKLSAAKVEQYRQTMERGRWVTTGDTIRMSKTGRLLNGQHTLHAIVQADTAYEYDVVWGLEDQSIHFMDTGSKRSLSQSLYLRGYKNPNQVGGAVRMIWQIDNGGTPGRWLTEPTYEEFYEYIEANPEILTSVAVGMDVARTFSVPASPVAAAHFFCWKINASAADDFFADLANLNVKVALDSPVVALRKTITSWATRGSVSRSEQASLYDVCLRAFEAYRASKKQSAPFRLTRRPKTWRR